jgi:chaperonin GroEL
MTTSLEVVEGMRFDSGYLSPYFVTNRERMHAVHDDGYVLLAQGKLDDMHAIVGILEQVHKERRPLLIVADEVEGAALQALIVNRVNSDLRVAAVKAPGYGPTRETFMQDIAVLTGTRVAGAGGAAGVIGLKASDLGRCKRFVVDARTTTIVALGTTKDAVAGRVAELRTQLADPTLDDHGAVRLRERIARLASGVAVVKVGGATELEMVERKHRIEDALHATRAAVEEGIVPGGGTALFAAARSAAAELASAEITKDERAGVELVLKACSAPLRRIAQNAGEVPEVVLERTAALPAGQGFNAGSGRHEDLLASGVIDPVKVCRTALKHAASVACVFTTLDAVVVPVTITKEDA